MRDLHGFKRRLTVAKAIALGYVELELHDRVQNGYDIPVIHRGEIKDWYKRKEATDLYFLAKKLDPSYRDNYQQVTNNNVSITKITYRLNDSSNSNQLPATDSSQIIESSSTEAEEGTPQG